MVDANEKVQKSGRCRRKECGRGEGRRVKEVKEMVKEAVAAKEKVQKSSRCRRKEYGRVKEGGEGRRVKEGEGYLLVNVVKVKEVMRGITHGVVHTFHSDQMFSVQEG